jgi:hypothetical protein
MSMSMRIGIGMWMACRCGMLHVKDVSIAGIWMNNTRAGNFPHELRFRCMLLITYCILRMGMGDRLKSWTVISLWRILSG